MERVQIRLLSKPKLKRPILICGMPDTGDVGRLGPYHIAKGIGAEPFAELYSYYLPPQIMVRDDGTADPVKCQFFSFKSGKRDLIVFTGDAQAVSPEGQHLITESALQLAQDNGCRRIYTLGAFITTTVSEPPRVFGTATSMELLEELSRYGVEKMKDGNITGMNGLLFGLSKARGMEGIGLFGETLGHLPDARAARALIEIVAKILDLNPNLDSLREEEMEIEEEREEMLQGPESPEEAKRKTRGYIT